MAEFDASKFDIITTEQDNGTVRLGLYCRECDWGIIWGVLVNPLTVTLYEIICAATFTHDEFVAARNLEARHARVISVARTVLDCQSECWCQHRIRRVT